VTELRVAGAVGEDFPGYLIAASVLTRHWSHRDRGRTDAVTVHWLTPGSPAATLS
jgi:hypothetical protein